jgi:putative endonuclease
MGRVAHSHTMDWTVYIIHCDDDSLYTGITTDLERRFREHRDQPRGAKYFGGRKPLSVVYTENGHTRSSASRREAVIKKLQRSEKKELIRKNGVGMDNAENLMQ